MISLLPFILLYLSIQLVPLSCYQLPSSLAQALTPLDLQKFEFHYTGSTFLAANASMLVLFDYRDTMSIIDTPPNTKLLKCAFSEYNRVFFCVFWEQSTFILRSFGVDDGKLASAVKLQGFEAVPNRLMIMKFCSQDKLLALVFNATIRSEFDNSLSDKKLFVLYRIPHYHTPLIRVATNSILDVQTVDYQSHVEAYYFERAIRKDEVVIRALYCKLHSDEDEDDGTDNPAAMYWKEVGVIPYQSYFSKSMEFKGEIAICVDNKLYSVQSFGIASYYLKDQMSEYIDCQQGDRYINVRNLQFFLVNKSSLRLFDQKSKMKRMISLDNTANSRFLYAGSSKAAILYFGDNNDIYYHELRIDLEKDNYSPLKKLEYRVESMPRSNSCRKNGFFSSFVEKSLKDLDLQYNIVLYPFELVLETTRAILGPISHKKAMIVGDLEGQITFMHREYVINSPGSTMDVVYVPKEDSKSFYKNFTKNLNRMVGRSQEVQIVLRTRVLSVIAKENKQKGVLYDYIFYAPSLHGEYLKPSLEILVEMLRKGGILVLDRSQLPDIDSTLRHEPSVTTNFLNSLRNKIKTHVTHMYIAVEKLVN